MTNRQMLKIVLLGTLYLGTLGVHALVAQDAKPADPAKQSTAPAASADQKAPATDTRATLYVYRPHRFQGGALKPSVYVDDKELARIVSGRFFVAKLEPGVHVIRSNDKASGINIDMKPGTDYYARIDIQAGFWKGHGGITLVAPEQGSYEVKETKVLDAGDIKDRDIVIADASLPKQSLK